MITFIFLAIAIITAWCDIRAYRKANFQSFSSKAIIATVIILLNILPIISIIISALSKDNTEVIMALASWSLTIYTIATLTRIGFYIGFLTIKHNSWATIIGSAVATVIFAILCNSLINTRTNIVVKNISIKDDKIPSSFNGFRVALFSDLHIGSLLSAEQEISTLTNTVNSLKPDMVIFAGDLLHIRHTEITPKIAELLSSIKAPHGVYSVLGNHDTGVYIQDSISLPRNENIRHLNAKINQIGWTMLQDSTIYAVKGRDSIAVTGIDFTDALLEYKHSFSTPDNFSADEIFTEIPEDVFNIAISHLPQLWQPLSEHAELIVSGHVHATQIAVELFGKRFSPAMLMYKEWSGLYSDGNSHLYITDGIGSVGFHLRIGANPEVTIIELNR